jgi:hypothetical protein
LGIKNWILKIKRSRIIYKCKNYDSMVHVSQLFSFKKYKIVLKLATFIYPFFI